jgi:hypothetical protein
MPETIILGNTLASVERGQKRATDDTIDPGCQWLFPWLRLTQICSHLLGSSGAGGNSDWGSGCSPRRSSR